MTLSVQHDLVRAVMGDDELAKIVREIVATIRSKIAVDWYSCAPVRAKLRTYIRPLLVKYDYQRTAVDLVLRQMETFPTE